MHDYFYRQRRVASTWLKHRGESSSEFCGMNWTCLWNLETSLCMEAAWAAATNNVDVYCEFSSKRHWKLWQMAFVAVSEAYNLRQVTDDQSELLFMRLCISWYNAWSVKQNILLTDVEVPERKENTIKILGYDCIHAWYFGPGCGRKTKLVHQ